MSDLKKIKIIKNWPYMVNWWVPLEKEYIEVWEDWIPLEWQAWAEKYSSDENYLLCRCWHSKNKPFCDSSHLLVRFDWTETAKREPFLEWAKIYEWPDLTLYDNKKLCSSASFCDRAWGIWKTILENDTKSKKNSIEIAANCPSWRLVILDKSSLKPIEPSFNQSISVTQDPDKLSSWPLWIKWYIEIGSSDWYEYEKRNRVALCRCWNSWNKPFCNWSHLNFLFNDWDAELKQRIEIIKKRLK